MEAGDQQMNLCDSKKPILLKTEPLHFPKTKTVESFGKMEPYDLPKKETTELVGKRGPLDLPKTETLEPFGKTEPFDFSQFERAELFGKVEVLDFAKKMWLFGQPLFEPNVKLNVIRIRDFINLLLTYSVRTVHDSKLKFWTLRASHLSHSTAAKEYRSLLLEKPLKYFEGLMPKEIINGIEAGRRSIFAADKCLTPQTILNLAADLAVHQLIQTLLSGDHCHVHHVMLSTRNGIEKRVVMEKIEATLKDEDNMLRLNEIFHGVIRIDASKYESKVEVQVQQQIAQQLQLPMTKGNNDWLIKRIEEEMISHKYLVFLVDGDAEETLDPRTVGFPKGKHAGVTVLITTESPKQASEELTVAMDLEIRTEDHLLPWEVFCQNVGSELVRTSSNIQGIAVRIAEECGSHLLAVVLVAKSLKNVKDVKLWELALHKLRCPHPSYDICRFHGQSKVMVNAFINFIWDGLNKTHKNCLKCCLFVPEIINGKLDNELVNDWVSYLLVYAREAEHNLRDLVDRSILLQFEDIKGRYIWFPEDTYTILQSLNTLNPLFIKEVGLGLTESPNSELWYSAIHIELADNKLSELPLSPNCLELKVLMLQGNTDLMKIPPTFFSKMPLLCILDISYTSIRELPNSFFELEHMRELYLKGCERFMKLPPQFGKLKNLEKLDLEGTQVMHMPEEFQELTNLESLSLCFCEYRGKKSMQYTCSKIIPSGVISKFKRLKHLIIDVNPDDERWHDNVQVILPEIFGLKCLKTLNLYFPESDLLKFIPACIFQLDFRFVVGRHMQRIISGKLPKDEAKFNQSDCSLKFVKGVDVSNEIKMLVRLSKALFLDRHMTIKNLLEFEVMNLEQVRVCILAECKEMQTIIDGRHSNNKDILPHLLLLSVSYMKNLRSIWEGPIHSSYSFGMLKSLTLCNCPRLTTIFTLDFLDNLSLLKVLVVKDCPKVSTLITHGSSKLKAAIFLPNLRLVSLLHLPELISISNGLHIGPSLENIGIYDCPRLQSLSKMELSSKKLKVIKGETKWWEALKWSKVEWGKAGRPSKFDHVFFSVNQEAHIMTQLGSYNDEDIDDSSGGSMSEPSQLTEVSITMPKSPPLSYKASKNQKQKACSSDRRKTLPRWTEVTTCPDDDGYSWRNDGYSWRKYGHKEILNAKFPRDYFRCTHRNDQQCFATKQVQQISEDPHSYEITYRGRHTCKPILNPARESISASIHDSVVIEDIHRGTLTQAPINDPTVPDLHPWRGEDVSSETTSDITELMDLPYVFE